MEKSLLGLEICELKPSLFIRLDISIAINRADMNPMAAIFAIGSSSRPVPSLDEKFTVEARDFVSLCLTR